MKSYIFTLIFLLSGCVAEQRDHSPPKYTAGQKVKITTGFYKDCVGVITGFYGYDRTYRIDKVTCNGTDMGDRSIEEQYLGEVY